jgi:DNA mismatch repair protein MutL
VTTIRLLPEDLSNQIAAGEVVERPASVVKELCENAVDAGARRIRVDVESGGVELVRVADDGAGMDREDARLAVLRHATSKIGRIEDLAAIRSFGFRGEALPSIASVSRFSLRTRRSGDAEGTLVRVEGGGPAVVEPAGCAAGSVVEVRELFFNVPARRKFLKATATESARVTEVVEAAALGEPGITFILSRDGRVVGEWPRAQSREERVRALFPGEELTPCRGERGPLRIEAYLSRPERARTGAAQLLLFVNGRPVRDRALSRSVALAYGSVLEAGRYPQGAVYLELPHELIDVNVHPQKSEVRFADARAVGDALFKIVAAAVRTAFNLPDAGGYPGRKQKLFDEPAGPGASTWVFDTGPGVFPEAAGEAAQAVLPTTARFFPQTSPPQPPSPWPGQPSPESKLPRVPGQREGGGEKISPLPPPLSAPASRQGVSEIHGPGQGEGGRGGEVCAQPPPPPPPPVPYPTALELAEAAAREKRVVFGALRFVGQVRSTFFVCEGSDGLYMLDQHAAAERVTFHRLKRAFDAREVASQKMLFPVVVEVSASEAALVEEQHEVIGRTGLEVRAAGPSERLLRDLLDEVSHAGERAFSGAVDRAIATMACHGSLRAGDPVAPDEARALLEALDEVDFAGHCPHGRPVVMRIGWGELEHRVGRK